MGTADIIIPPGRVLRSAKLLPNKVKVKRLEKNSPIKQTSNEPPKRGRPRKVRPALAE